MIFFHLMEKDWRNKHYNNEWKILQPGPMAAERHLEQKETRTRHGSLPCGIDTSIWFSRISWQISISNSYVHSLLVELGDEISGFLNEVFLPHFQYVHLDVDRRIKFPRLSLVRMQGSLVLFWRQGFGEPPYEVWWQGTSLFGGWQVQVHVIRRSYREKRSFEEILNISFFFFVSWGKRLFIKSKF